MKHIIFIGQRLTNELSIWGDLIFLICDFKSLMSTCWQELHFHRSIAIDSSHQYRKPMDGCFEKTYISMFLWPPEIVTQTHANNFFRLLVLTVEGIRFITEISYRKTSLCGHLCEVDTFVFWTLIDPPELFLLRMNLSNTDNSLQWGVNTSFGRVHSEKPLESGHPWNFTMSDENLGTKTFINIQRTKSNVCISEV